MVSTLLNMTGEMAIAGGARLRSGWSQLNVCGSPAMFAKQAYITDVTHFTARRLRGPS